MAHSILMALLGGAILGLSASILLYFSGRIAGISGIVGGLLKPIHGDTGWRVAFVGGMLAGGVLLVLVAPQVIQAPIGRSMLAVGTGGLLVGVGVRMGNGCTSGHGICGLTRFSKRSLVATASFMGAGILAASAARIFAGGVL